MKGVGADARLLPPREREVDVTVLLQTSSSATDVNFSFDRVPLNGRIVTGFIVAPFFVTRGLESIGSKVWRCIF